MVAKAYCKLVLFLEMPIYNDTDKNNLWYINPMSRNLTCRHTHKTTHNNQNNKNSWKHVNVSYKLVKWSVN